MGDKSKAQAEAEQRAIVESERVFTGKTICVQRDKVAGRCWDLVTHPGAVVIVPVTEQGEILLIEQWRRAAKQILLELPAGTRDQGEDIGTCAQRELREETGYRARKWVPLGGFFSAPGFCTEYLHLFIGKDLVLDPLPHDEDEAIDLCRYPLEETLKMIESGAICDAKTIAGLFRYDRWLKTQK
jgi:ADP-ribose pyrophosphatase